MDQTTPCLRSKPGPLLGFLHMLLTLVSSMKPELEICSPRDLIDHSSSRLSYFNFQHNDLGVWWDLVLVATQITKFRLPYHPRPWFWPTYAHCDLPHAWRHMLPTDYHLLSATYYPPIVACHTPSALCLLLSVICNTGRLWIWHAAVVMEVYSWMRLGVSSLLRVYLGA